MTVDEYLSLITSEHRDRPKFAAMIEETLAPLVSNQTLMAGLYAQFDLETAAGAQLDVLGEYIGQSRQLAVPITGIYFAFDTLGVGFDEGIWKSRFDPDTYIVDLPDDVYRRLLKATIGNNRWDGTIPDAYAIWAAAFAGTGTGLLVQDFGNMHMLFALTGTVPDALTVALFREGRLTNKPAGVKVDAYLTPGAPGAPYFGFDISNDAIDGFDIGAWGVVG